MRSGSGVPERVLPKARQLFFARGYPGTSLRAIASASGASESSILRIYGSKQGLLRAVYASCWAEINARVEKAIAIAAQQDPDPRNLLVALARAVLLGYQEEPASTTFILSHFCYRDTCGLTPLDDVNPIICEEAKAEYHRYLARIQELCESVTRSQPAFARAGVHAIALTHALTAMVHGIQVGWYVTALEGSDAPQATLEDAIAAVKLLLYRDAPGG